MSKNASLNRFSVILLIVIILTHVFLLTKLIFFPYPELFIYPYLTNQGLKPYSQILDQHSPGLLFFSVNLNNLGVTTPEVARLWLVSIVIVVQVLLFLIARKIFKNDFEALLVNILYLVLQPFFEGWVFWIDSFIPLLTLLSFYFIHRYLFEKKDNVFIFISALFLGLGIIFKQTVFPLAGIIFLFLYWQTRSFKILLSYLVGLFIPILFTLIYFVKLGVIRDFWYWAVVFNLTTYSQQGLQIGKPQGYFTRILLIFATPITGFLSKKKEAVLALVFMLGSLFGALDRLDFVHFQPALPFALLATGMGFKVLSGRRYGRFLILFYSLILIWWISIFLRGHILDKILFFDAHVLAQAEKIRQYTKPGDKIFLFGTAPHLYQMTETLPAGNIFVFQFPWFMTIAQDRVLEGLKADVPKLVLYEGDSIIEGQNTSKFMYKIDQYIKQNFTQIDKLDNTIIMRKITP